MAFGCSESKTSNLSFWDPQILHKNYAYMKNNLRIEDFMFRQGTNKL